MKPGPKQLFVHSFGRSSIEAHQARPTGLTGRLLVEGGLKADDDLRSPGEA